MFNPQHMMGMMGTNPNQIMQNMLYQNPLFQRAIQMAQGKSETELMKVAENICREKGINVEQAKQAYMSMFNNNATR